MFSREARVLSHEMEERRHPGQDMEGYLRELAEFVGFDAAASAAVRASAPAVLKHEAALTHDFAYYLLGVGISHSHREYGPGGKIPPHLMVATMSITQSALAGVLRAELASAEAALEAAVAWNKLLLIHLNAFLVGYFLPPRD